MNPAQGTVILKWNSTPGASYTVWIAPDLNPDGVAAGTRHNAHGVDLNRNFEAANRENSRQYGMVGLSEPESRALHGLIVTYRPDRIISIHQPLRCIDYDGPASGLARVMVAECDLPLQKLGARPGSLGAYAGATLGIPIITVELPTQAGTWSSVGTDLAGPQRAIGVGGLRALAIEGGRFFGREVRLRSELGQALQRGQRGVGPRPFEIGITPCKTRGLQCLRAPLGDEEHSHARGRERDRPSPHDALRCCPKDTRAGARKRAKCRRITTGA